MSNGFLGRVSEVRPGLYVSNPDGDSGHFRHEVWVQPLVPGEPKPDEVWENHGGRHLTITSPPYTNHWSGARIVPTDGGNYLLEHLRPIPVHPWHRRADGSAADKTEEPRWYGGRRSWSVTTEVFQQRGLCERKGARRQDDE